jgi:uncharacterized protein (DUF2236 family)
MEHGKFQLVSAESLEYQLSRVRTAAAGSLSGVFGPRSVTWQIDRESAIFLGAGRALLLQLAHPWVAAAIAQHSDTFANPVGRFHRTFSAMFSMVFGTLATTSIMPSSRPFACALQSSCAKAKRPTMP